MKNRTESVNTLISDSNNFQRQTVSDKTILEQAQTNLSIDAVTSFLEHVQHKHDKENKFTE